MARVGIVGLGFIGRVHLATLRKTDLADVVAVADKVPSNLEEPGPKAGNIPIGTGSSALAGIATYDNGDALLADPQVEVALIALPTYLHKEFVLKALDAGKHVICEKPLALTATQGEEILQAAAQSEPLLFVAHCIRFWPAYVAAREIIKRETYGSVLRAHFARVSPKPRWSWQGWLMDQDKSGGALLDLHIHDVDYVNDVFGRPDSIVAEATRDPMQGVGDVMATYRYDGGPLVTLEGSWVQHAAYPFRMSFRIVCEKATLQFDTLIDGRLRVYPAQGGTLTPEISQEDGYACEHRYFFDCMAAGRPPERVTVQSSCEALALVEDEKRCIM